MSYFRKKLERRTFSQDRYYILIKRQKSGKATFSELTELDEIVNRVPDIRDIVIKENFGENEPEQSSPDQNNQPPIQQIQRRSFWNRMSSLISKVFTTQITTSKLQSKLQLLA